MGKEEKAQLKDGIDKVVVLVALILVLVIVGYGYMHISFEAGRGADKDNPTDGGVFKTATPAPTTVVEDQPSKERRRADIYLFYAETAINCWEDNAQAVKDIDREIVVLEQKEEERRQKGLPLDSHDGRNEQIDELIAEIFELCL